MFRNGGLFAGSGHATAQDHPNNPIRLIVGFPPGAGTDATARVAAEFLSQRLGQSVAVENKAAHVYRQISLSDSARDRD